MLSVTSQLNFFKKKNFYLVYNIYKKKELPLKKKKIIKDKMQFLINLSQKRKTKGRERQKAKQSTITPKLTTKVFNPTRRRLQ